VCEEQDSRYAFPLNSSRIFRRIDCGLFKSSKVSVSFERNSISNVYDVQPAFRSQADTVLSAFT
jgi:hypothetical protein